MDSGAQAEPLEAESKPWPTASDYMEMDLPNNLNDLGRKFSEASRKECSPVDTLILTL